MPIENYELFLFDFDGLLVDTERLHFLAYKKMCEGRGYQLLWDFEQFCGIAHRSAVGLQKALYEAFPSLPSDWQQLYQEKKTVYEKLLTEGSLPLMPGVDLILSGLEALGKKRAVVTNSSRKQVEIIKKFHPILQTVPLWITREDYSLPKPAPDGYLLAIQTLAPLSARVIGFEDSLRGLQSLYAARAEGVLVCSSFHPQMQDPLAKEALHFESLSDAMANI